MRDPIISFLGRGCIHMRTVVYMQMFSVAVGIALGYAARAWRSR